MGVPSYPKLNLASSAFHYFFVFIFVPLIVSSHCLEESQYQ